MKWLTSEAACIDAAPNIFDGDLAPTDYYAKTICSECPLRASCLDHALRHHEVGIWGGTNDRDRDLMRRPIRNVA